MDPLAIGYILGFFLAAAAAAVVITRVVPLPKIRLLNKRSHHFLLRSSVDGVSSIITGNHMTLATVAQTVGYLVVPFDRNGNPTSFSGPLLWTSNDTGIATVSVPSNVEDGDATLTLTGRAGTVVITVSDGVVSASDTLVLTGGPATRIQLTALVDGLPPVMPPVILPPNPPAVE